MLDVLTKLKTISLQDIICACKTMIAIIPAAFIKIRHKNIWLMAERPAIADDNGWMLYHWIRREHPEDEVYFVLDKSAYNYDASDNHMIPWNSWKHYIYYIASDIHINTLFQSVRYNPRVCSHFDSIFKKKTKRAYIRHGIHKDGLEMHKYEVLKVDLFLCGAKPEYDYFKKYGGYPERNLKYTGLARFDDLLVNKKDNRFILLIPTWRRYLIDDSATLEENQKNFLNSKFFITYNSMLNNGTLSEFLLKNNMKMLFCLHAQFRMYENLFNIDNDMIEIVGENVSIHKLLMETSLLITDYSSVFFDAAYADKPIIYFHFDYEEFRSKHFSDGYFSYERDGMGPIAESESALVDCVISTFDGKKFISDDIYAERRKKFFPLHDTNNCQRIYDEIKNIRV